MIIKAYYTYDKRIIVSRVVTANKDDIESLGNTDFIFGLNNIIINTNRYQPHKHSFHTVSNQVMKSDEYKRYLRKYKLKKVLC